MDGARAVARAGGVTATTSTGEVDETGPDPAPSGLAGHLRRHQTAWLAAALAVPFVVAVVVLRDPPWYADQDFALNELRVRDVLSGDPPLIGMSGRIVHEGARGSHPGPLGFWLMAPVYWVFGRSSWALQVAAAALSLAAVGATLALAARRAGRWGAVAATAGMAGLLFAYGPERWATPWNPFLAAMWWPVVLLAVWSVLCGDHAMAVVAVVAGSICAQAHIAYLGLVGGMMALALAALVVRAVRTSERSQRRSVVRWMGAGCAVGVLLWVPPLIDQARHDPGNLAIIRGQFSHPSMSLVGWRRGVEIWLGRLDPWAVVTRRELGGGAGPGIVVLAAWATAAFAAGRRRLPDLVRLHLVVGVALCLGLVSIARIQGRVFGYLLLWSWSTVLLLLTATVATAVVVARSRDGQTGPVPAAGRAAVAAGAAVALVAATWSAAHAHPPAPEQAQAHARLLPEVVDALEAGDAPGDGRDGRYLVRSDDPVMGGLNSYTLLLELERQGFDVGIDPAFAVAARPSRVLAPDDATAVVTYVVGPAIDRWRARPDAVELAQVAPPGSDAGRDAPAEIVRAELRRAGLDDLAAGWDGSVLALVLDTTIPDDTLARIGDRVGAQPIAVFLAPAG